MQGYFRQENKKETTKNACQMALTPTKELVKKILAGMNSKN
jgi:hypothetical protein